MQDDSPAETDDDADDEIAEADGDDEEFDDKEFDEDSVRALIDEMTLQDMVAARVVSTYWLESVLNSLRPPTVESAALAARSISTSAALAARSISTSSVDE